MKSKLLMAVFVAIFANTTMSDTRRFSTDILRETFGYNSNTKSTVSIGEIHQGCRARDCIPSIDRPQYGSIEDNQLLSDKDVIMLVDYNGVQKGYPLKIMQGHEIVNDNFKGKPLAVTYCPLCASAVAFVPEVAGEVVEFGVSGLLHNSDLVMYDRKTHSLWGQITGRAIMGPQTGTQLKRVYVAQISFKQAKAHFPDMLLLKPPKGSTQNYRRNYYENYFANDKTMFPVALTDDRLKQKTKIHGFVVDGQAIAVGVEDLVARKSLSHTVKNRTVIIKQKPDGTISVTDRTTGETFVPMLTFWFAWVNFYPKTLLLK